MGPVVGRDLHGVAALLDEQGVGGDGAVDQALGGGLLLPGGGAQEPAGAATQSNHQDRSGGNARPVPAAFPDASRDAAGIEARRNRLYGDRRKKRRQGRILALPDGHLRRLFGVRREPGVDQRAVGRGQLAIDIGVQRLFGHLELAVIVSGAHFTVLSLGSSALPVKVLRAARARPSRDIRVPIGMSRIVAASA